MATYRGTQGLLYTTTQQIGHGGEGAVYSISGHNALVAKIYRTDRFKNDAERATMERKLKAMISMKVPYKIDNVVRFAWPQDILYENNTMVGFIMPRIGTRYKIYDVYREGSVRDSIYPNYTWKYSIQFAYHLAWLVYYLHSKNIVIGDFNQNNIAIDAKSGTVIIIDCDSFDIKDPVSGEHFPCVVGLPEMLAPELQKVGSLKNGTFTKESDYFSLAIHIFRLLMNNADPFGGVIVSKASQSNVPMNQPICKGECVYVRNVPNKKIPASAPELSILPWEIGQLFNKTFNYTELTARRNISKRATAYEWCNALAPYGEKEPNPRLKTCRRNNKHVFSANNTECPWCRLEAKSSRLKNGGTNNSASIGSSTYGTSNNRTVISNNKTSPSNARTNTSSNYGAGTKTNGGSGATKLLIVGILIAAIFSIISSLKDSSEIGSSKTVAHESTAGSYVNENPIEETEDSFWEEPTSSADDEEEESVPNGYIFYDSNNRYLSESELYGLTEEELTYALNEIYARRGRGFKTDWIREYFESTDWYQKEYDPDYFDKEIADTVFNDYEKENINLIAEYQKKKGYR